MLKIVEVTTQCSNFSSFHVRRRKSFLGAIIIHPDHVGNEDALKVSSEFSAAHDVVIERTIGMGILQSVKDVVQLVLRLAFC